jgi:hypothetical protein
VHGSSLCTARGRRALPLSGLLNCFLAVSLRAARQDYSTVELVKALKKKYGESPLAMQQASREEL